MSKLDASDLIEIESIRRLKHRYGEIVDQLVAGKGPADWYDELFTEDADVRFPEPTGLRNGREAITRFYTEEVPSRTVWSWHSMLNDIVTVRGDSADARWMIYSLVAFGDGKGPPTPVYGRYVDRFVRGPKGWRFSALECLNETRM